MSGGWPYNTARWARLRRKVLAGEPMCRACASLGRHTPATDVDHIVPIRQGGPVWRLDGLQPLCAHHHSFKTGTYDKAGRPWSEWELRGCNPDGSPRDPDHPWNSA